MLAEQHKQHLTQAVAAAQQQERTFHSQQVSSEIQAQVTQIQAQHAEELTSVREQHAQQQGAAQAAYAEQIAAVEAEAEQHRQSLQQVLTLAVCIRLVMDLNTLSGFCCNASTLSAC